MVVAPAAIRVARKQNLRVVLDLHENRPEIMKEYRHVNRFPGNVLIDLRTWAKEQAELIAQADKVVVVTELAKSDILKTTKSSSDVIVLPNTPSLDFRDFPLQDRILKKMAGTFNLLYVGDTSLRRGTDDTVRALAALKSQIPEIRLWIVGKSSADPALKQLARDFDLADAVMFEGWQDQSLFGSYMTGAHICLSPLKRNPHHDTTYANKLFQYMAMAKAVIVSDSAAQQRVVEEEGCGLVYPAGDVTMLAETVLTLYRDAPLLKTLGEKGRKAVEDRWNWEKTSEALLEMYKRI
jgi:glycosyltransferase involved in cell wall biosynthesis